ncbi:MFS transporter [Paenibacillus sp. 7124]|uniref:MFS transporter n=1 Tax=Paenibacillus apii TaxID=1850370 RepID=A0A6M1PIC7_9BACL|nr:MFS transporter [Paenibacillus apii]NGM82055.1 MFS transporter [Paenibacillus apii]NJJ39188.1 MFS transporter [Paenibacillus apii]
MELAADRKMFSLPLQWLLAAVCAIAVANLYYDQVLLSDIIKDFNIVPNQSGLLLTVIQAGYTLGLVFIVPLGDRFNRRKLILISLLLSAFWLVMMTLVSSFMLLLVFGLCLGFSTVSAQLIIPFVSSNIQSGKKGPIISRLLTGIFLGVLLGRVFGGWIGQLFNWQTVHWVAAFILLVIAGYLFIKLPDDQTPKQPSYKQILRSMIPLLREEPVLRETIILGGAAFAAFNIFWVSLTFMLNGAPYHFDSGAIGMFGIIGIAGAIAAGFSGRLSDSKHVQMWNIAALLMMILSFVVLGLSWNHLILLIAVTFLLDVGSRMNMTLNQGRIYQLAPEKHSRLNSLYMVGYYFGGSAGSGIGSLSFHFGLVPGVAISGCLVLGLAILYIGRVKNEGYNRKKTGWSKPA